MDYSTFLANKSLSNKYSGKIIEPGAVNPVLFDFQRDCVVWACRKGRAALFLDTGLGKTNCQVEWGRLMGGRGLIVAPLTVAKQTIVEAKRLLDIDVHYTRSGDNLVDTINITNFEMIEHFDAGAFEWVVIDESSILKSLNSKTRQLLTDMFADTPYKLCCTATPAPNDIKEIGYHAEFLGMMRQREMLSCFFRYSQAGGHEKKEAWRLKKHAVKAFYKWLASWSLAVKFPSDLGYSDEGYILPPLNIEHHFTNSGYTPEGMLPGFTLGAISAIEAKRLRKQVLDERVQSIAEMVNSENLRYNISHQIDNGVYDDAGRKETAQSGIHERMDKQESRQGESQSGQNEGSTQQGAAGQIRTGRSSKGKDKSRRKGVGQEQSSEEESAEVTQIWDNDRGLQSDIRESESSVRDLRLSGNGGQELFSVSGSLPQNEQGERITLHQLQSGIGDVQGQHSNSGSSDSLFKGNQWVIFCALNEEADKLHLLIPDSVNIQGSMSPDAKADAVIKFQNGSTRVVISKASIIGFGINLQNCSQVVMCGIDYSWEQYYQAIRRFWRFGQKSEVNLHIFIDEQEEAILNSIKKKEREATAMTEQLIAAMREYSIEELHNLYHEEWKYQTEETEGNGWLLKLGDSCERIKEIPDNSIDISVYSPPFSDLFVYSATPHDIGNCATREEFFEHYGFIIRENLRITKPGRMCFVHCSDLRSYLNADGYIGVKDFSGDIIEAYQREGWVFQHRITIQKNPQTQAVRLKDHRLLFITLEKDSLRLTGGMPDYLLMFSKPGESEVPVKPIENENMSVDEWQRLWIQWAAPVWTDIRETDVLPVAQAKAGDDEKHMCPLQLPVIERCLRLWSNPGETLFSPFAGVGSEGFEALKWGRKFIGIELKKSYYDVAVHNLNNAEQLSGDDLFAWAKRQQESAEVFDE